MGGRLLDYIAQGLAANRPLAADMGALIADGAASIYYSNDTLVFGFYNSDTIAWDEFTVGGGIADGDYGDVNITGGVWAVESATPAGGAFVVAGSIEAASLIINGYGAMATYAIPAGEDGRFNFTIDGVQVGLVSANATSMTLRAESGLSVILGISSTSVVTVDINGAAVNGYVTVDDEVYGAGWDGSIQVPTKNAVYDELEGFKGKFVTLTQVAYDALGTPDPDTFYFIVG